MLIVELNIAGHRLSREWAGLSRGIWRPARFNTRVMAWKLPQQRQSPAA